MMNRTNIFIWTVITIGLIGAFLLIASGVDAETYYIDATLGNDSNTGTHPDSAWASLAKIEAVQATLAAGDSVLSKRGEHWWAQPDWSCDGSAGNLIVFGAYGEGADPVFDGSAHGTGWQQLGSTDVYFITGTSADPDWLFYRETPMTNEVADTPSLASNLEWFWTTVDADTTFVFLDDADDTTFVHIPQLKAWNSYGSEYIKTENITFQYFDGEMINTSGHGCVYDNLTVKCITSYGIYPNTSDDVTVSNCTVHTTRYAGINMRGCNNMKVYNNLIYDTGDESISIGKSQACSQADIYHNTIYNCDGAYNVSVSACDSARIRNNIIFNNKSDETIRIWSGTGTIIENNILWRNTAGDGIFDDGTNTVERNNINEYPAVNDTTFAGGYDFGIPLSSPCVDTGKPLFNPYDILGNPRGTTDPDIGAYEYQPGRMIYEIYGDVDIYQDLDLLIDSRVRDKRIHKRKADAEGIADEITAEALKDNDDPDGRPLPLASSWLGGFGEGEDDQWLTPDYQIELIEDGHYILPSFYVSNYTTPADGFYTDAFDQLEAWGMPFSLAFSQPEDVLNDPPYSGYASDRNPNLLTQADTLNTDKLSPFAPEPSLWDSVGYHFAQRSEIADMQEWYPNPPKVIFLSNNESTRLAAEDADDSKRFTDVYTDLATYGNNNTVILFATNWVTLQLNMINGIKAGLDSASWRDNSIVIGYGATNATKLGLYADWELDQLSSYTRSNFMYDAWDGSSSSHYHLTSSDNAGDYLTYAPFHGMHNSMYSVREALRAKPNYWFERTVWDGGYDEWGVYKARGQTYPKERFKGFIRHGIWIAKPRVVREFNYFSMSIDDKPGHWEAIMECVDEVHTDETLRRFWREGRLVPSQHAHPWASHSNLDAFAYQDSTRFYALDTDPGPTYPYGDPLPWTDLQDQYVWAIANVIGESPNREWLIFAHSPETYRSNVEITVPDYGTVTMDVPREGAFKHVEE